MSIFKIFSTTDNTIWNNQNDWIANKDALISLNWLEQPTLAFSFKSWDTSTITLKKASSARITFFKREEYASAEPGASLIFTKYYNVISKNMITHNMVKLLIALDIKNTYIHPFIFNTDNDDIDMILSRKNTWAKTYGTANSPNIFIADDLLDNLPILPEPLLAKIEYKRPYASTTKLFIYDDYINETTSAYTKLRALIPTAKTFSGNLYYVFNSSSTNKFHQQATNKIVFPMVEDYNFAINLPGGRIDIINNTNDNLTALSQTASASVSGGLNATSFIGIFPGPSFLDILEEGEELGRIDAALRCIWLRPITPTTKANSVLFGIKIPSGGILIKNKNNFLPKLDYLSNGLLSPVLIKNIDIKFFNEKCDIASLIAFNLWETNTPISLYFGEKFSLNYNITNTESNWPGNSIIEYPGAFPSISSTYKSMIAGSLQGTNNQFHMEKWKLGSNIITAGTNAMVGIVGAAATGNIVGAVAGAVNAGFSIVNNVFSFDNFKRKTKAQYGDLKNSKPNQLNKSFDEDISAMKYFGRKENYSYNTFYYKKYTASTNFLLNYFYRMYGYSTNENITIGNMKAEFPNAKFLGSGVSPYFKFDETYINLNKEIWFPKLTIEERNIIIQVMGQGLRFK